jgi:hypothetical protein
LNSIPTFHRSTNTDRLEELAVEMIKVAGMEGLSGEIYFNVVAGEPMDVQTRQGWRLSKNPGRRRGDTIMMPPE